ncbi:endogenous retrovirus group K member 19 Pol protein-like isoform X2 [Pitangus sulphuratus]|nr:endogenous retrovirus group K member 19 Pol protein-like isoform X2 [Pitangus sulphuratus]
MEIDNDLGGTQEVRSQLYPDPHDNDLKDEIRRHNEKLQEVLDSMKNLDGGQSSKATVRKAYDRASKTIFSALDALADTVSKPPLDSSARQEIAGSADAAQSLSEQDKEGRKKQAVPWMDMCIEDGTLTKEQAYRSTIKTLTKRVEAFGLIVTKANQRFRQIAGTALYHVILPLTQEQIQVALEESYELAMTALANNIQLKTTYPLHPLFKTHVVMEPQTCRSDIPLQAVTVFSDASNKTGKAGFVWQENGQWQSETVYTSGSVQVMELAAVVRIFEKWLHEPINVVFDSQYVVGLIIRMHRVLLKQITNKDLYKQFLQLWHLLDERTKPYFVTHIRNHTQLPGPLVEGNRRADQLVTMSAIVKPNLFQQAQLSHEFFHQNSQALKRDFNLTLAQARTIVAACPECARLPSLQPQGVNPRGLAPLQLCQTDVTEYAPFGRFKYLHVSIDMHSSLLWTTALINFSKRHD